MVLNWLSDRFQLGGERRSRSPRLATAQQAATSSDRPFGVTIIALIQVVNAASAIRRIGLTEPQIRDFFQDIRYLDLPAPILAIFGIVLAQGLWRMRHWAWVGTMIWAGLNLAFGIWNYLSGEAHFLGMALSVAAVFYLNQREVQLAFAYETQVEPDLYE